MRALFVRYGLPIIAVIHLIFGLPALCQAPKFTITTIAGNGTAGYSGDGGLATVATLNGPAGVAVDKFGNVYISDYNNNVVRKVDSNGIITTFAGTGKTGYSGDGGPAASATLDGPEGLAISIYGKLYICDTSNFAIRAVDLQTGVITTFAGGTPGYSGDGGFATKASLYYAEAVAVDDVSASVYISDTYNQVIR